MADIAYSEPMGENWKYNPDYHRVTDFLGIDKYDREKYDVASKVSFLVDWGESMSKSRKIEDVLWRLNDLRKKLGVNTQGKTLLNQVYEYARLESDSKQKPEANYKDVISEMVVQKEKREREIQEGQFKKDNLRLHKQIQKEQVKVEQKIQDHVQKYRESLPKDRPEKIKVIDNNPKPIAQRI